MNCLLCYATRHDPGHKSWAILSRPVTLYDPSATRVADNTVSFELANKITIHQVYAAPCLK